MSTWPSVQCRARPEPGFVHGVAQLDEHGCELQCDALWFPSDEAAKAWAVNRKWQRYVLKVAVLG